MIKKLLNFITGIFKKRKTPKESTWENILRERDYKKWMGDYSEAANFHYDCGDR